MDNQTNWIACIDRITAHFCSASARPLFACCTNVCSITISFCATLLGSSAGANNPQSKNIILWVFFVNTLYSTMKLSQETEVHLVGVYSFCYVIFCFVSSCPGSERRSRTSKKRCPVMAVDLGDSEIQLMKAYDDLTPIIIKTEMTGNLAFLSQIISVTSGLANMDIVILVPQLFHYGAPLAVAR